MVLLMVERVDEKAYPSQVFNTILNEPDAIPTHNIHFCQSNTESLSFTTNANQKPIDGSLYPSPVDGKSHASTNPAYLAFSHQKFWRLDQTLQAHIVQLE